MSAGFTNFVHVLKRFKASSLLNLAGLTVALASFFIIAAQVDFEYGQERCHPLADRIYRVELQREADQTAILPYPLTQAVIRSSPQVEAGSLINPFLDRFYITVEKDGQPEGFRETFVTCNADITRIFHFKMLEGRADCLHRPEQVLIPASMASRMFGPAPAVGQRMTLTGNLWTKQTGGFLVVGGVYEDFPANTQLNNYIYTAFTATPTMNGDWASYNYFCYLLLDENARPEEVSENFNTTFDFKLLPYESTEHLSIRLTPLRSIYFANEDPSGQLVRSGNPTTPLILLTIGALILLIAAINYTNFAMALAPRRMRSIQTHKIFGSTNAELRTMIAAESVLMSLVSFVLAVAMVYGVYHYRLPLFEQVDIHPMHNLRALLLTGLAAVVCGLAAGLRPAFYMTSLPPAMALNGHQGLSPSGKRMRTVLIGFQFFVSIVLIFCAFFLYKQNLFMQRYTLGYDTEQMALVELPQSISRNRQPFAASLKEHAAIEDVAFSQQKFGAGDSYRTWSGEHKGESIGFYSLSVSWNFPAVMGIRVLDGRLPEESDVREDGIYYVINQNLQKKYGIAPGDIIHIPWMGKSERPDNGQVLGVVGDLKFTSLRQPVDDMAFVFNDHWTHQPWAYVRIRAGADAQEAVQHIRKTVAELDATFPLHIEFYDEVFDALYRKELNTGTIIGLFGLIAVIIAVAGVFGLVMFDCEYKRKEIGIRKVMGSTEGEILLLFNKMYLAIFVVGFVLALPAGYCIMSRWLEHFAYKTPLSWWGFFLAGTTVLAVIVLTVCVQAYRAATQNPTKALNFS
jgi:putative ABC transport system permease protein